MEWWEDLYNRQIYFDLYEEDDTHLAEQQVQQVLALLHPADGASILDLCCGYGRHSIQLAQRGFRVTGIDISEKQIQHAREVAQQAHVPVDFRVADARKLNFHQLVRLYRAHEPVHESLFLVLSSKQQYLADAHTIFQYYRVEK